MKHNYKPLVSAIVRLAFVLGVVLLVAAFMGLEGWAL